MSFVATYNDARLTLNGFNYIKLQGISSTTRMFNVIILLLFDSSITHKLPISFILELVTSFDIFLGGLTSGINSLIFIDEFCCLSWHGFYHRSPNWASNLKIISPLRNA